jgi:hypothetical protein
MEQLEDNLGAANVVVTPEDIARIDEVAPPGRAVSPYYQPDVINTDFGPHPHRW